MASKMQVVAGVLSVRRYAVIAAASAAGLGVLYFFLTISMLPQHAGVILDGGGKGGGAAAAQHAAYMAASVGLAAVIAALGGINIAMVAFKAGRRRGRGGRTGSGTTTFLGGALSAFTPGCPACTAPLAVVLGAAGGLSVLPMQGLELKLVSAGVLALSIYWIARGLQRPSCCSA